MDAQIKVLAGTIENIKLETRTQIDIAGGTVSNIEIGNRAVNTLLTVQEGASVEQMIVDATIEVAGQGEVKRQQSMLKMLCLKRHRRRLTEVEALRINQ